MLARLKALLSPTGGDQPRGERELQLAAAALLIETARADYEQGDGEQQAVTEAIRHCFELDEATVAELMADASDRARAATSLYEFTREINNHFDEQAKYRLICQLWRVAGADGNVHKYEDHLIRKVAELIYVSHARFIQAKHETLGTAN